MQTNTEDKALLPPPVQSSQPMSLAPAVIPFGWAVPAFAGKIATTTIDMAKRTCTGTTVVFQLLRNLVVATISQTSTDSSGNPNFRRQQATKLHMAVCKYVEEYWRLDSLVDTLTGELYALKLEVSKTGSDLDVDETAVAGQTASKEPSAPCTLAAAVDYTPNEELGRGHENRRKDLAERLEQSVLGLEALQLRKLAKFESSCTEPGLPVQGPELVVSKHAARILLHHGGNRNLSSVTRVIPPMENFEDLVAMAENMFPGWNIGLFRSGTIDQIRTQFELNQAYLDVPQGSNRLELDLFLTSIKRKREPNDAENDLVDVTPFTLGPWTVEEKTKFQLAVHQVGWGNWSRIAEKIGTRSRQQVRDFSRKLFAKEHEKFSAEQ